MTTKCSIGPESSSDAALRNIQRNVTQLKSMSFCSNTRKLAAHYSLKLFREIYSKMDHTAGKLDLNTPWAPVLKISEIILINFLKLIQFDSNIIIKINLKTNG